MINFHKITEDILLFIYNISSQPVKLDRLLQANLLFQEGMKLDGSKLGFRIRLARAYLVFFIFIHIIIIPMAIIFHDMIKSLDCHIAIVLAIIFTSFLFGLFSIFKQNIADRISEFRIKQVWKIHFPHFPYKEYSKEVAKIYSKAIQDEIRTSELERYILDNLTLSNF